jgi:hypothetical protein
MDTTTAVGRVLVVVLVTAAFVGGGSGSVTATGHSPCIGTMERPAEGTTLVSVQGARGRDKKAAQVLAIGPDGGIEWVHHSRREGVDGHRVVWSYDIDPLPDGNVFVTATVPGDTLLYELDTRTGEPAWLVKRDALDTHDADYLGDGKIAVANMRNYDEASGENRDRLYIYDRNREAIVWEWRFAEHFSDSVGGEYADDWTHVNDIDRVGEDRFLVSPRNFDQVLVVDRETGEIVYRLGAYGDHDIMRKQHNPDYLTGPNGAPTIIVADSENDRIVEYTRDAGAWNRTWNLGGGFAWPRDADRLPNGNTLITDSRNHRVLEVRPNGSVVWEVYTPWLPYDAERVRTGDGSRGPTMAATNAPGPTTVTGAAGGHRNETRLAACAAVHRNTSGPGAVTATPETPLPTTADEQATSGELRTAATDAPRTTATTAPLSMAVALVAVVLTGGLLAIRRR